LANYSRAPVCNRYGILPYHRCRRDPHSSKLRRSLPSRSRRHGPCRLAPHRRDHGPQRSLSRPLVVATTALLAATCRRHHSGAVRRRDHVRYVPDVVRIVVSISAHQSYSFMLFLRQNMQPPGRKRGRLPLDDVTNCNAKGFTLSFQVYVSLLNLTSAPSGHMLVTSRSHSNCRL